MTPIILHLPESLQNGIEAAARREGVSVEQFLASAAAEKLSAWLTQDHLRDRAKHARRDDFIQFLEKSPSAPPLPRDEID